MTIRTVPLPAAIDAYAYIDGDYRPARAVAFNIDADEGEANDFVVIADIAGDIVPCVVPFLRAAPPQPAGDNPSEVD